MDESQPGTVPLLETRGLVKRYGGVHALKGVSLRIEAGTVHGLLGENGAGKSTLVKIVAGLVQPTEGTILLDGERIVARDVRAMEDHGVFLVAQEPMIVGGLSVADNLMLGRWPTGRLGIDDRRMHAMATEFLVGTGLDPGAPAWRLNAVDRRKLNILRALHSGGRLIILDEPTTALTLADRAQLFAFMERLKRQGATFLFISHYNEEILEICDAVSVLRDGELAAGNRMVATLDSAALSELVLGRGLQLFHRTAPTPVAPGPGSPAEAWRISEVRSAGLGVDSLVIAPGEIVGFAGLPGSGARELARALFGLLPGCSGRIGQDQRTAALPANPAAALKVGIAFLSEDRLKDGVVAIQSIHHNICLSSLGQVSRHGWISAAGEASLVRRFFSALGIKASSPATRVGMLSGGNQQKVCLSRLLATSPRLLILNEPTRGIDVGVKEEVHRLVNELTREGVSVIVVSSDLDETLRFVDRVVLFAAGRVVADRPAAGLSKDEVLALAFTAAPAERLGSAAGTATEERIDA